MTHDLIRKTIWHQHNDHTKYLEEARAHGASTSIIPSRILTDPGGRRAAQLLQGRGIEVLCYHRICHGFRAALPGPVQVRQQIPGWWTEAAEMAWVDRLDGFSDRIADDRPDDSRDLYWYDHDKVPPGDLAAFYDRQLGDVASWCNGFLFDHLSPHTEAYEKWQRRVIERTSYLLAHHRVLLNGKTSDVMRYPYATMVEAMGKHWSDSDDPIELASLIANYGNRPLLLDTFRVPDYQNAAWHIAKNRAMQQGATTYVMLGRMHSGGFYVSNNAAPVHPKEA